MLDIEGREEVPRVAGPLFLARIEKGNLMRSDQQRVVQEIEAQGVGTIDLPTDWEAARLLRNRLHSYMETTTAKGTSEMTYSGSRRCPICQCSVMIHSRKGIKKSLMAALAMADHAKVLHGVK